MDRSTPGDDCPNVLLVEDDDEVRKLLCRQLKALGCDVETTKDAGGFLTAISIASRPFDFIIVDIGLPDLNGNLIISWLRESEDPAVRDVPILIITGCPDDIQRLPRVGNAVTDVLAKPYTLPELSTAMRGLTSMGLH